MHSQKRTHSQHGFQHTQDGFAVRIVLHMHVMSAQRKAIAKNMSTHCLLTERANLHFILV